MVTGKRHNSATVWPNQIFLEVGKVYMGESVPRKLISEYYSERFKKRFVVYCCVPGQNRHMLRHTFLAWISRGKKKQIAK